MESTKVLTVVAVVAVAIALFGVVVTFMTVGDVLRFAGKASSDTGDVNLSILAYANINFSKNIINWSSGAVITNATGGCTDTNFAILETSGVTGTVTCGLWRTATGLVLENIGNSNVTVYLRSNNNATDGVAGPFINSSFAQQSFRKYDWRVVQNETGSCNSTIGPVAYTSVNYTIATGAQGTVICPGLNWDPNANGIRIDFNVTVPTSAPQGAKQSLITAEAFVI